MIARIWHGATEAADGDRYLKYLRETGVPDYEATEGNHGVYLLRRIEGHTAHFLLISLWDSFEVIKGFAGEDIEKARYYPEDERFLVELEPTVSHYEVFDQPDK